jgi:calcineurin-like phosphoesterase family protein
MSIAKDLTSTKRRIFVTADTHFGHAEAISIFGRPFGSADEMDDAMVAAINDSVGAKDILVHLGDFMGPCEWDTKARRRAESLRAAIRCKRIYLVRGNHDPAGEKRFDALFEGVCDVVSARGIAGTDERIVLFHYPISQWQGRPNGGFHLHGHVHGHGEQLARRCDVGIDVKSHRGQPRELLGLITDLRRQPPSGFTRA